MKNLLISLFLVPCVFGGQSIGTGPRIIYNGTPIPNTPVNRVEFYMHDWASSATTHVINSGATGWLAYTLPGDPENVTLLIYNMWESGGKLAQIRIGSLAKRAVYVRCQHDPANKVDLIEAWDVDGNRIANHTLSYSSERPTGTNFQMGYGGQPTVSVGFMRAYSTLVPLNSRPPVTFDNSARVFEWKFDGNLTDASGNGRAALVYLGTPAYIETPYQNTVAVIKTTGAPTWTNVVTQRAGYPATLDGSGSFSQADSRASVSCFWQQLSGPSTAQFSSRSSCTPVLTGLVFGDYLMQLTVTDDIGRKVQSTAHIGAVAMDDKGVVVNADPKVDEIFGNMIAFGKNPWSFADYWSHRAMTLRAADYVSSGWSALQWEQMGSGTVDYYWNGVGYHPANVALGTTLTSAVSPTSTTLTVSNAGKLDLSQLPTRILLFPGHYPSVSEEVRICAVTGNTLTVCYDGRGQNRQSWSSGALVGQAKVTGTGTRFVTDAVAPVCQAGAPGPPGPVSFSGGSVQLTAGSDMVTGIGTRWSSSTGNQAPTPGDFVRVAATHGGAPFQFIAQNRTGGAQAAATVSAGAISSVTILYGQVGQNYVAGQVNAILVDPTGSGATVTANVSGGSITSFTVNSGGSNYSKPTVLIQPSAIMLNRVFPADADSGVYPGYGILKGSRTLVLRSQHAVDTSGTGESMWNTTGCESETALYLNPTSYGNSFAGGHDVPALNGTRQRGYGYSVTDSNGWVNQSAVGGISFYGESLGSRALYYRSGLKAALDAANVLDDNLIKSPWANRDVTNGSPLWAGGLAIGAFASGILTGRVPWSDLRSYAASGEYLINGVNNNGTPNCEYSDTRDTGYAYAWVILSAIYDPDTSPGGFRSRWRNALVKMRANDNACKRSDNSWALGFYWNRGFGPVTMTANSTAVTGSGLSQSACAGVAAGSGTVVKNSATITLRTGTFPSVGANTLVITGTLDGTPFTGSYVYMGSGTSVTLSVLWPGDSGTVTWMAVNNPPSNSAAMTTFAKDSSDYDSLKNNYACIWNSSTSLTLDHPWKGVTGSNYFGYMSNLAGYGQQPFMLGIKEYGMGLMAAARDPALAPIANAYKDFSRQATQWLHDKGVDEATLTTNYGRVFPFCEPTTTGSSAAFDVRTPGCNYGNSLIGKAVGRQQNQELGNAVADFYLNNPNGANKDWGDKVYGAVWGHPAYNKDGVFVDDASDAANIGFTNLTDAYIRSGKWYGFFAGMGMLHRWPAVRLGGVEPAIGRKVYVPFSLTGVPNATKARITLTQPSGAVSTQDCATSPCEILVDTRAGSVLIRLDYLNVSGRLLAQGDNLPLYLPR